MLKIFKDPEALSQFAAARFAELAQKAVVEHGQFRVALTGGSSPKRLHELLTSSPYKEKIAWEKTRVFWGDERYVPIEDEQSNARMAFETLLSHVPVPHEHIHIMTSSLLPEEFAAKYEKTIEHVFGNQKPAFDLILLGMGDDGHTASLFPGTPVLQEEKKLVASQYLEKQSMYRITMTKTLLNYARNIIFLVFGEKKAETLANVLEGPYQPEKYPVQFINPESGTVTWLADEEAASKLTDHKP